VILRVRWRDPTRPSGEWTSSEIISAESWKTVETAQCKLSEQKI